MSTSSAAGTIQAVPASKRSSRLRLAVAGVVLVTLALYLLVALGMVYLGFKPERHALEAQPADFGLQYEDVSFHPRGGDLTLRGWLLPGQPGRPYLIFVHGIGDQRTGNAALDLASRLIRGGGYNLLLFDLRAQGLSDGSIVSAGQFERYDVLGAYDFLISRGAEPGRIGLVGRSYGAATAIMAASMEPGIAAVVADSPFADVQDRIPKEAARKTPVPEGVVRLFMPPARLFADLLYGIHLGDLKPARDVAKLSYPVFIIHGEADERISVSEGRRVYEAAPPGSELWTLPGVTHTQAFRVYPDEYVSRVEAYLAARFGP